MTGFKYLVAYGQISMDEFISFIGIDEETIISWAENGKLIASEKLLPLAKKLNIPVEWLTRNEEELEPYEQNRMRVAIESFIMNKYMLGKTLAEMNNHCYKVQFFADGNIVMEEERSSNDHEEINEYAEINKICYKADSFKITEI